MANDKRKTLENKKASYIAELEEVKKTSGGTFDCRIPQLVTEIHLITSEIAELDAVQEPAYVAPETVALDTHEMKMTHEVGHQSVDEVNVKPKHAGGRPKRKV